MQAREQFKRSWISSVCVAAALKSPPRSARQPQVCRSVVRKVTFGDTLKESATGQQGDITRREAQLFLLEHVHGETIGVNLASRVVPKAIHLIALDAFDGHQWSS
jgi:hypothetical protein